MQGEDKELKEFLSGNLFIIPPYQRPYSWEITQLKDLWEDVINLPEDRKHYFGDVVLYETGEIENMAAIGEVNKYHVIDGQQRVITTLIFLKSITEVSEKGKKLLDKSISNVFFPELRAGPKPRVTIKNDDGEFLNDIIFGDGAKKPENPAQQKMVKAKKYLKKQLSSLEEEKIEVVLRSLLQNFKVNRVIADDKFEAASMFETINDRGKGLTNVDKTKSFLIYLQRIVDEEEKTILDKIDKVNQFFGTFFRKLYVTEKDICHPQSNIRNIDEDKLQRFHWQYYKGQDKDPIKAIKKSLWKNFKDNNRGLIRDEIIEYSESLKDASEAFEEIATVGNNGDCLQQQLDKIFVQGRIAIVMPVLLAAKISCDSDEDLSKIIDMLETMIVRMFMIDRKRITTGSSKLVELANTIFEDDKFKKDKYLDLIRQIIDEYTPDDRFRRKLEQPDFYQEIQSEDLRYIFYFVEADLRKKKGESGMTSLQKFVGINSKSQIEIEHIWSKKVSKESLPVDIKTDFELEHLNRLGNLSIAERGWNQSLSNANFEEKKYPQEHREFCYDSSQYCLQNQLTNYEEFNKNDIQERERELKQIIMKRWSIYG